MKKTVLIYGAVLFGVLTGMAMAEERTPIKIGEINSYKAIPLYTENYRKGWELAVEQVNAAGGIKGRKVVVIDRDDQGKPEEAIRVAQELVLKQKVCFLSGGLFGNVTEALADFAGKNKIPTMRWMTNADSEMKRESDYAFALNSIFITARAPVKYALERHPELSRWASIAPNYAYGHQATSIFSKYLLLVKPDSTWLDTYWYQVGHLDVGPTIGAIEQQQPDAVLNVSFGSDVTQLIRMGKRRDFDKNRVIVSLETGMPEYLNTIGAECPEGWIMTGYPVDQIHTPEHDEFVRNYVAKYGEKPGWMSLNGYDAYQFIFAAMKKSPTLKARDLVAAMEGVEVDTPVGRLRMRPSDHLGGQGIWVGVSRVVDGKPELDDWKYYPGDQFLVDESKVKVSKSQN